MPRLEVEEGMVSFQEVEGWEKEFEEDMGDESGKKRIWRMKELAVRLQRRWRIKEGKMRVYRMWMKK